MNQHQPIRRASLASELVGHLRDLIIGGELKPGARISEPDLCARYAVSRTPLREALKMLAAEGLVTLLPNRGARVAVIDESQIGELFPIMGMLEALAAELCAERMTDRDLARLERMHAAMVQHHASGAWTDYIKLNRAIHEAIFAIAGNATLTQLYDQLMVRIHAVRFVARKTPERWREAVDDHERLMAALRRRDKPALNAIMREHLVHKADVVRAALAALAGSTAD